MQAFVDHDQFGHLPRAGGTFDQPDELMREMRVVASIVNAARRRAAAQRDADLERRYRRGGIR